MKSRQRIGLYGSGDVPRSKRLWSRMAGPESRGLKDLRRIPIARIRPSVLRKSMVVATAIVALTAVIVMVSAFALEPTVSKLPARIQAPPPPYTLVGTAYDSGGAKAGGAILTITNVRIGTSGNAVSDDGSIDPSALGLYFFDLSTLGEALSGDEIRIQATWTTFSGLNTSFVPTPMGGFMWENITLNLPIPEFGDALVPAVGMIGAFIVVALVARVRDE